VKTTAGTSITYITSITFITPLTVTLSTLSNGAISVSQVRSSYTDTGPEHELMAIDSALIGLQTGVWSDIVNSRRDFNASSY
jgi:hypothetical protein